MFPLLALSTAIALFTYIYYYLTRNYNYWPSQNVPSIQNFFTDLKNHVSFLLIKNTIGTLCTQLHRTHPKTSLLGFYHFGSPVLLLRDPELVKNILQTNFQNFARNTDDIDESHEPILFRNPFFSIGEKWKIGRARFSTAFTAGKLKIVSGRISDVCYKYADYIQRQMDKTGNNIYEVEIKSSLERLIGEIAAVTAFSIEGHCFEDPVRPNTFRDIARSFYSSGFADQITIVGLVFCPSILEFFGVKFLPRKLEKFFEKLCESNIEGRKAGSPATDFFQIMIDHIRKETSDALEIKKSITSQMVVYFTEMYETLTSSYVFVFYQLACHREIQEKVREEIKNVLEKHGGNLTMEAVNEMSFMDQVISESMRIDPTVISLMKICTKKTELVGSDGVKCVVEPGTKVYIPVLGLQTDPTYWENPKDFDPARFSSDAVNARNKFVYIPFNEGPRSCVGQRLTKLIMKMALSTILTKFTLELSPKTKTPLEYVALTFLTHFKGGLWIVMKPVK